ncbi:MAG: VIT family protein [Sphingomonadales bacterium]|nr:VIT family protein [Sphingomonadales bacterium]NCO49903.1 VIT family protein [Sphingomonadales bacterium]NCP00944.1 VIT family protein [Sphingomonadales bacterium]NCP27998.1 VIT family protein [Sphingomonadales bacterium]NCP42930.1 VIT family protein [Sphingomonadales bacterium]
MSRIHDESHRIDRVGWLRAAVLGANDGIVSTGSLVVGVAAAATSQQTILLTAFAGLVAGAMSMAAGEYVSVSSQADSEKAERAKEAWELEHQPKAERIELISIYKNRGLTADLAEQVTDQMTAHDALGTHLRDELGLTKHFSAKPLQAALASALAFAVGAILPVILAALLSGQMLIWVVSGAALALLAALGAAGAMLGGAPIWRPVVRVTFWGAAAMAATAAIGSIFGATVA